MPAEHPGTVRSFVLTLYDRSLQARATFTVPVAVAAPFANRLLREAVPGGGARGRGPWDLLLPHPPHPPPLVRATAPEGPTSLLGTRYTPGAEPLPRVRLHPQAHVRHFSVCLLDFQQEIYRGEYTVDDVLLAAAEFLA